MYTYIYIYYVSVYVWECVIAGETDTPSVTSWMPKPRGWMAFRRSPTSASGAAGTGTSRQRLIWLWLKVYQKGTLMTQRLKPA